MPPATGKQQFCYDYPRPMVTVDVVIATTETPPRVLLIQRGREPFAGMWAVPGGFVDMDEGLEAAARRELHEETGVEARALEQLGTFGDPGRDPRGRTISVVYLARVEMGAIQPVAGDDAAQVGWFSLEELPPLAFDHAEILALARKRLQARE